VTFTRVHRLLLLFVQFQLSVAMCWLLMQQVCRRQAIIVTRKSWVMAHGSWVMAHGSWVTSQMGHGSQNVTQCRLCWAVRLPDVFVKPKNRHLCASSSSYNLTMNMVKKRSLFHFFRKKSNLFLKLSTFLHCNKCISRLARRKSHHMALGDGHPHFRLPTAPGHPIPTAPIRFVYSLSCK